MFQAFKMRVQTLASVVIPSDRAGTTFTQPTKQLLGEPNRRDCPVEMTLHLHCSKGIPVATVKRLMSAVSFGYGIFHLAVSLLPPKLLHLINAFGFEGDRQTGIQGWMNEFNRLLRL